MSNFSERTIEDVNKLDLGEFRKGIKHVVGPYVGVILFINVQQLFVKDASGNDTSILLPDTRSAEDLKYAKFRACVGKVFFIGEEAFEDARRFPKGPRCELSDWVLFPRNEGMQVTHKLGFDVQWVYDDRIFCALEDPTLFEKR